MKIRSVAILTLLLIALASTTSYEARPGGIGSAGDGGCSCHGGINGNTQIILDGLPEVFNASEEYTFTLTIVNDGVNIDDSGAHGGFRIIPNGGVIESIPDINGNTVQDGVSVSGDDPVRCFLIQIDTGAGSNKHPLRSLVGLPGGIALVFGHEVGKEDIVEKGLGG